MKTLQQSIYTCLISIAVLVCTTGPVCAQGTPKAAANPIFIISTNKGAITIELDQARSPVSVQNFIDYAEAGFYTGTIFHRVIPNFMIQGGGFTPDMKQKPTRPAIKNEARNGLSNKRGTVAMARTSAVDSATAQFFINLSDNTFLDHGVRDFGYAVFGRVVDGMNTVDAIARVKAAGAGGHQNVPVEPIIITGITRKK
jgi:peptidyl-prolyl cis-trans isomerase A (cyclophilin A)